MKAENMRSSLFLVSVWAAGSVLAQTSALAGVPNCGLVCLETAVGDSSCALTNTTCVCLDAPLQTEISLCVLQTCNVTESLLVKNATDTLCDVPVRSQVGAIKAITNTMGTISGVAVGLRLLSKLLNGSGFEIDDYVILLTLASGIPSTVLIVFGLIPNGLGTDLWANTPRQITEFIHIFYTIEILYFAQVALLKLCLLSFYYRIFPGSKVRKLIVATGTINLLYGLAFVFAGIFQCQPINYYWKRWDGAHIGTCVNINVLGWANAVISIVLDVWMLGIPIIQLLKLQMHWKKKVSVGLMFVVGTFVTVISVIRLRSLILFANSANPTWDNADVAIWSTVEINVGIICVCMPNLRLLIVRFYPKAFGSTLRTNTKQYIYNGRGHSQVAGNISVDRTQKSSKSAKSAVGSGDGIMMSHSYTVQYGEGSRRDPDMDSLELIEMGRHKKSASSHSSVVSG